MLPHIQKPDGISKNTQYQFGGYDRRPEAADGTFYDTLRLSTAKAPLLSSRGPYSAWPGSVDYVFGNDVRMMIRNGDEIWYGGFVLAQFERQLQGRRAVRFGTSWIVLPDKVMIKLPGYIKGKVTGTAADLSNIQNPAEGDTWVVKGILEDNPYLYTYTGGAWVKGEKVLQDMEASVTITAGNAGFGDKYSAYGGSAAFEESDWNTLRAEGTPIDWSSYFKVGDAVKISGCTAQPKNNQTLVIREINGSWLRFYDNSFTNKPADIAKLPNGLPAMEEVGGVTYRIWYKATGHFSQEAKNFTLYSDAQPDDVLVNRGETTEEMEQMFLSDPDHQTKHSITLSQGQPTGTAPGAEPVEVEFEEGDDIWHGTYNEAGAVTVAKLIPDMDYMFCDSNRLWGCKDSKIYASALGDPTVFWRYDGLSDDSWAVEVFSPGKFTGAISVDGYPTFFKENIRYKVYGSQPSAYQLSETSCDGVKEGSGDSLAIVEGTLYYVSPRGIMADTGAQPYCISRQLGLKDFSGGCAGVDGTKYVISLQEQETWQTFLYDTELGLWLRDESRQYSSFANVKGVLYGVKEPAGDLIRFDGATPGGWVSEGTVQSEAVTNDYVLEEPNRKGLHRVQIRTEIFQGASLSIYVRYNGGRWVQVKTLSGGDKQSYYLPVLLRRCDHFALKFVGTGSWVLHSLALETVHGSAIH